MSRKSKLSQWWQKQTGEEETPFDSDSSAFIISVMIHVVILVGLGLWPFIIASDNDEIILTTTSVDISEVTEEEPPEQIHFSEQQMASLGGQLMPSSTGMGMAVMLSNATLERLNGSLTLYNHPKQGAIAMVSLKIV